MGAVKMQHLITKKLWSGVDWLAGSKRGRRLTYAGIMAVSMGICLISGVLPNASNIPGWMPAITRVVASGTQVIVGTKVLGVIKAYGLPQTIWVLLTKKAAYYELQRPIYGHGLLVWPIVITGIGSLLVVILLAVFLARYRRRYQSAEEMDEPRSLAELLQFLDLNKRSSRALRRRSGR